MTLALLVVVSGALGAWEHQPAQDGHPEVFVIRSADGSAGAVDTTGERAAAIFTVRAGYADDTGLFGLTAQTQQALLHANPRLAKFQEQLFANGVTLELSVSRQRCNFVLTGSQQGVTLAAQSLAAGLFQPKVDDSSVVALSQRGSPQGPLANEAEFLAQMLEPVLLKEARRVQVGQLVWHPPSRIRQHISEYFSPANTTVTLIGIDRSKVPALKLVGGTRRERPVNPWATDVSVKVPSSRNVHVLGYPLPPLDATQVAGMRVVARLLQEELLRTLRQSGSAYSISVVPTFNATFSGVLILIPAYDSSGLDLETGIMEAIFRVTHDKLTDEDVKTLVTAEQDKDRLLSQRADQLADELVNGSRLEAWESPEYQQALAELNAA
ncbi:MAG: insulinase family protein, partial [Archangium sp.]|nr:insulinase family protein [Archangium sp.]